MIGVLEHVVHVSPGGDFSVASDCLSLVGFRDRDFLLVLPEARLLSWYIPTLDWSKSFFKSDTGRCFSACNPSTGSQLRLS